MELTKAQKRLIKQAQQREGHRIEFFGIPEKTRQKLIDNGYVIVVFKDTEPERNSLRGHIANQCRLLGEMVVSDNISQYTIQQKAREIERNTRELFATKSVLTDRGLRV